MSIKSTGEITVAVSSCLLGQNVRYDGSNKFCNTVTNELGRYFRLLAVCPEIAIGMGVPRKPVRVVQINSELHVKAVEDTLVDVTELLHDYARDFVNEHADIYGYVFKQRSPSCGLGETPLFNHEGQQIGQTDGVFAAKIKKLLPDVPVIDEQRIEHKPARDAFIEDVLACYNKRQPLVK